MVGRDPGGPTLADLLATQVSAHTLPERVRLQGPEAMVAAEAATPLGLVLNELITNAAKYGSLSAPSGVIDITWRREKRDVQDVIILSWSESGGLPVLRPAKGGKGLALINSCLPKGSVDLVFDPAVVKVSITVPSAR